jgi:hypothetical protein
MFKMTSRNQLTCPEFDGVYRTAAARRRLFRDYQHLHTKMLVREQAQPTPPGKARACFFVTQHHSIFVYLTSVRDTALSPEICLCRANWLG